MSKKRSNGEGSIFPYRNGWAAYVWVTTPTGDKTKKWAYGKTREEVHEKYVKLLNDARRGPVATSVPTVDQYLTYWLAEVVIEPDFAPLTIATYESLARLYVRPHLGKKRLDKLTVQDMRLWLNKIRKTCQCCAQGKDAARPPTKQRCCAKGQCCNGAPSERTVRDALNVIRSALSNAITEEFVSKNVAASLRLPKLRKPKKDKPWGVEEARQFLEAAREADDPFYAAYVLVLVLGLRKGEVLGLTWEFVDLDNGELFVGEQLQRVRRRLLRRRTKTDSSEAGLPLPDICVTALKLRKAQQAADRERHEDQWKESGLVFTTRYGTPIEPRNFNRSFDRCIDKAQVRRIVVHGTRGTCATLLVALDVNPRVAMRILRHSQISVTMEVYAQAPDEATAEALRKLGGTLGAAQTA